jgi:nucleotide-binding universal stress UspA family protein
MCAAIKQVLVHVDASTRSSPRLAVARRITEQQGAALAALYAVTPSMATSPFAPIGTETLSAGLMALDEERRNRGKAAFDDAMKSPGTHAAWSDLTEFSAVNDFARQALYADLLVLGQTAPPDAEPAGVPPDFVESILLATRKPAVIVPWAGAPNTVGETVVVAWKETPESARAVAAAMPILQQARHVHVLSWAPLAPRLSSGLLNLESYLHAHHVSPVWHDCGEETGQVGDLLLSTSFDLDADLMVMGCYGHSRAREWVLGGTSRTVLQSMTLPVLMVH